MTVPRFRLNIKRLKFNQPAVDIRQLIGYEGKCSDDLVIY